MAPPTGPRGGSGATRPPTTRSSTRNNGNSATRGSGIRKRNAGVHTKVDRDGDMVMDAHAATNGDSKSRGTPSTRGRSAVARGSRPKAAALVESKIRRHIGATDAALDNKIRDSTRIRFSARHRKTFAIVGVKHSKAANNVDRGRKAVLDFLERKSFVVGAGCTIIKSHMDSNHTLFVMISEDDSDCLMKLDGFSFAGAPLSISESTEGFPGTRKTESSKAAIESRQQLVEVLGQRYNSETKLLNLSKLGEDPVLIGMGYLQDKSLAEKTFKVLMAICDDTFPSEDEKKQAVESVSMAGNNIEWVGSISELASTFPHLRHLDLSHNQFKTTKSLSRWREKFRDLETLLLTGNPIETEEPNFKAEIIAWYPGLMILSNEQIRTAEQAAAGKAAAMAGPQPLPQGGPDFRDVGGVGENFVRTFVPLYDTNKAGLIAAYYDDASQFSLSVSTHMPRENKDTPVLPWTAYIKYSRNMKQIATMGARIQRLFRGAQIIQQLWASLPMTKHPDLSTETHKYTIDCHPIPGLPDPSNQSKNGVDGLIISIHGEFDEIDPSTKKVGKRSFTRTFVLGPGGPDKPIRVINDMLSLRAYSPIPGPAVVVNNDPTLEQKQQMVIELSKQTNMTSQYSEMCLTETAWNFDNALAKFNEIKPNLGPEVFMQPA